MKHFSLKRLGFKLALWLTLAMSGLANAQFQYNADGDALAGFRKTGGNAGSYELVVNLGNITNFLKLSSGTMINITNYATSQLTNAFADTADFANLQWSVFATYPETTAWTNSLGTFGPFTLWLTLPGTNVTTQTKPPTRHSATTQANQGSEMGGVGAGAINIGGYSGGIVSASNNAVLVQEPVVYTYDCLSAFIGDATDPSLGDFGAGGHPLGYSVENVTPDPFISAQRNDLYQLCPTGSADPFTGLTTGSAYFVGYFILNPNGSMTFTRASSGSTPPVAGFTGGPTNGFAGFSAVFTNTSTGTITNWIWNFGDGTIITNTAGGNVTHVYATGGNYNVTLTVNGPGGSNASSQLGFILVSPLPTMIAKAVLAGGQLVLRGTNCPAGVQYRILTSTNVALPVASWTPVTTNVFLPDGSYSYTNSTGKNAAFFRLVSP